MTITESALTIWTPEKVVNASDPAHAFAMYAQQMVGTWPSVKDVSILRKKAKEFFEKNPTADWGTACRILQWAKRTRKRPRNCWGILEHYARDAFVAGVLPELDPLLRDENDEAQIERALAEETRPAWRQALVGAVGVEARRKVLAEWQQSSS